MDTRGVFDLPASDRYPIYTRANAGEVIPDAGSPLNITLCIAGPMEQGWRDAYVEAGTFDRDEFEADRPNTVGVFGGYFFLCMSMTRIYGVRCPGMTPELVDRQYFGDMPGITPYAEEARPTDESPAATARMGAYLQWVFTREDLPELRADRDQVDRLVARRPDLAAMTDQELVDHARSHLLLYRRMFCRHIVVSAAAGIGLGTVAGILQAVGRPDLLMPLNAGLGDVDSAAPSWALWEMSRIVAGSPSLRRDFDAGIPGVVARIEEQAAGGNEAAAELLSRLHGFLRRFGARGPNEWELRARVWGTDPEIVLAALERMRFAPDDDSPQRRQQLRVQEREAAQAEARSLVAALPEDVQAQFEGGLRAAHVFSAGRERTKTNNIKVVHEIRLPLRELGRRMVERGLLDDVEQVFMLTADELDLFVRDPAPLLPTLRERSAFHAALAEVEPPFVSAGPPGPPGEWARRDAGAVEAVASGDVLTGIAGAPGVAVGRARVVLDPFDPRGLEPGDVLIAPHTDPSWTPLFVPAAAVVVDVGAQITHAVIVSRELGLPCVCSVIGATRTIPDGALIEVDGTAGTVKILDTKEHARA